MYYVSTRDTQRRVSASQAILRGMSEEGGLRTPETLPSPSEEWFRSLVELDYVERCVQVMGLFLEEFSEEELRSFARNAYGPAKFDHPAVAPVVKLDGNTGLLELWHGPTCAFKDLALQMLPQLLSSSLKKQGEERIACILVATSGDTGKGALEGFKDVEQTKIQVFYPKNGVSEVQQLQMTTQEGANVSVCAVEGNFDDAQSGVKRLFNSAEMVETLNKHGCFFSSANSINWGRVLPQIVYYVSAYCDLVGRGELTWGRTVNVCVPTGNFGNILAAYYAKQMGLPLGRLICASNENNVLTDFLSTGVYDKNRPFHTTISPSMDILISSNLERLLFELTGRDTCRVRGYMEALQNEGRYAVEEDVCQGIRAHFDAGYCTDEEAKQTISDVFAKHSYLMDTHTAVAVKVLWDYRVRTGDETPCIIASTASPFKFASSVLEALGEEPCPGLEGLERLSRKTGCPVPRPLERLAGKPIRFTQTAAKENMDQAVLQMLPGKE